MNVIPRQTLWNHLGHLSQPIHWNILQAPLFPGGVSSFDLHVSHTEGGNCCIHVIHSRCRSRCQIRIRRMSSFVLKDGRSKITDIVVVRISCSHHVDIVVSSYRLFSHGRCAFYVKFSYRLTEISRPISKALYLVHSPVYGKREWSRLIDCCRNYVCN